MYTPKHLADRILASKTALEGERKQVTVLFADLKGSMELLADQDPEDARRILDPVLERMMEAVHYYGGTVNQVMGDGIMALFGAPVAHEDHGARACYASLRMQQKVAAYAAQLRRGTGLDVQIRVGLNSGEVVVRSIGNDLRIDYSAVGQTTHLAARMEQLARPGTILLTPHTFRLVADAAEVRSLGPVPVKGLAEPVEVFELAGVRPVRSRFAAAAGAALTPFIGRLSELDRLAGAAERAGSGHGQLVALVGDLGVGTSRLFWEFCSRPAVEGWLVLEGTAVSYGTATAYLPLVNLFRAYFQIEERDEARRIRETVTGKLLDLDETLASMAPGLLALLEPGALDPQWEALEPSQRRRRMLEAARRLLLRECRRQPVLLVFENLQWIDGETQSFLDDLVDALPTARALLLVSYRPEYQHGWASGRHYTQLPLDALGKADADAMLGSLVGGSEELRALRERLVEQTEGNPLFIEESVRTLVETGVLEGERGAYRLRRPVGQVQVPVTVQSVVASRVDRLVMKDKRLLQTAAVLGREGAVSLLADVAELSEEDFRESLSRLQHSEFLYEAGLFPEVHYRFAHALTYEVVYGSLVQDRRRALHVRILHALETRHADRLREHAEQLAHHALRGEVWDKAVGYLREAGVRAARRAANQDAVTAYEQAVAALDRLPQSRETVELGIDLRLELRPPLVQLGELARVMALSQEAERLATGIGDNHRLSRVYAYFVNYHYLRGEPDLAIAYGERCLAAAGESGDEALCTVVRGYMGYSYHAQGRYALAESTLAKNVEAAEAVAAGSPDPGGIAHVTSCAWLAFTLADLGEFDRAHAVVTKAAQRAAASGHPYSETIAATLAGLVWLRRGQPERAVQPLEQSLDACREKQLTLWRPIPSALLGLTHVLLGRNNAGLSLLENAVKLSSELGIRAYLSLWTLHWAEGLFLAGQRELALTRAAEAYDLAVAHRERAHQAWALALRADIESRGGAAEEVEVVGRFTEALRLAEELAARPLVARVRLGLGRCHRLAGRHAEAERHLAAALTELRAMDMRHWLEEAGRELRELGQLFIVARHHHDLYEHLRDCFAGDRHVTVLLDRRAGAARGAGALESERRRPTHRDGEADKSLRVCGLAVIPDPDASAVLPSATGVPETAPSPSGPAVPR